MSRIPTSKPTLQNPAALKRLRQKDGYTQVALAKKAGITSQHLARMESGVSSAREPVLKALAEALGVEQSAITRAPCELSHCREPASTAA